MRFVFQGKVGEFRNQLNKLNC